MNLLQKFQQIKIFIFDIDGVLTNGDILVLESGEMARMMNTKDGFALQLAVKKGYKIFIVSGSAPSAVALRLNRLGLTHVFFQVKDKKQFVQELIKTQQLQQNQVLFMGDDIPDLPVFETVGLGCCPADAVNDIRNAANFVSSLPGGRGCVREVIEKVLRTNNDWDLEAYIASS